MCQHKNTNLTLIFCTKCTHVPFFGIRGWKNTKNPDDKKPPQYLEIANKLVSTPGQCVDLFVRVVLITASDPNRKSWAEPWPQKNFGTYGVRVDRPRISAPVFHSLFCKVNLLKNE